MRTTLAVVMGVALVGLLSVALTRPSYGAQGTESAVTGLGSSTGAGVRIATRGVRESIAARVSFDFVNVPAREAVRYIADESGTNLILDPGVTETVTLKLTGVSWRDALEIMAEQMGCIVDDTDVDIIRVTKPPRFTGIFEGDDLKLAVTAIARVAGVNVIIGEEVEGIVTAELMDVPYMQAMETIVRTAGFVVVRETNKLLRVVSLESLRDQLVTAVFPLLYVRPPDRWSATLKSTYVEGGQAARKQAGETLSLAGIRAGGQAARGAETQFPLLNAVQKVLSGNGSIDYDPFSNAFIVTDIKPKIAEIERVIKLVDVEPVQVFIDVKFVRVSADDLFGAGVGWPQGFRTSIGGGSMFHRLPFNLGRGGFEDDIGLNFGSGPTPTDVEDSEAGEALYQFGVLDFTKVTAVLTLVKTDEKAVLTQAPKLCVLDNEEATIFVGKTIRYAETFSSSNQAGGVVTGIQEASNSPVDTGFQLVITPHVVKGTDKIMLSIVPKSESLVGETSEIAGFDTFSNGQLYIDLPQIGSSTMMTRLMLHSGQTAVIGGLMDQLDRKSSSKVPILGDIPVLNLLFSDRSVQKTKQDLVILITARILRNQEDIYQVYRKHRPFYGEGSPEDIEIARTEALRAAAAEQEALNLVVPVPQLEEIEVGE